MVSHTILKPIPQKIYTNSGYSVVSSAPRITVRIHGAANHHVYTGKSGPGCPADRSGRRLWVSRRAGCFGAACRRGAAGRIAGGGPANAAAPAARRTAAGLAPAPKQARVWWDEPTRLQPAGQARIWRPVRFWRPW